MRFNVGFVVIFLASAFLIKISVGDKASACGTENWEGHGYNAQLFNCDEMLLNLCYLEVWATKRLSWYRDKREGMDSPHEWHDCSTALRQNYSTNKWFIKIKHNKHIWSKQTIHALKMSVHESRFEDFSWKMSKSISDKDRKYTLF